MLYHRTLQQAGSPVAAPERIPMITPPSLESFGLLLGLSFFLGLAFEDFFAKVRTKRPGGIRTFPLLALAGGMLYLFDPVHLIPYTGGLLVLGVWLAVFYREHIHEQDEQGEPNVGIVVLLLNVHAYLLGAITLALPNWIAVGPRSRRYCFSLVVNDFMSWHVVLRCRRSLRRANF